MLRAFLFLKAVEQAAGIQENVAEEAEDKLCYADYWFRLWVPASCAGAGLDSRHAHSGVRTGEQGEPAYVVIGWCGIDYRTYFVLPESVQEGAGVEKADDQEQDSAMPDEKEAVSVNGGCCGQVNVRCCAFPGHESWLLSRPRAASRTSQKKQRTGFAVKKHPRHFVGS